jgi:peptidoglycan hydrolase-like protein with peptidoglycan-binding domain
MLHLDLRDGGGGAIPPTQKYLKLGDAGQDVKDLQTYLNSQGANLDVDGMYGPLTDAALKDFNARSDASAAQAAKPVAYTPKVKSISDIAGGLADRDPALAQTVSRGGAVQRAPTQTTTPVQTTSQPDANQQLLGKLSAKNTVYAAADNLAQRDPALANTVPSRSIPQDPNVPEVVTGRPDNVSPLYKAGTTPTTYPTGSTQPATTQPKTKATASSLIPAMPTGVAEVQTFSQPTMQTMDATAPLTTGEELPPIDESTAGASAGGAIGGISTASGGGAALGGMGGTTPPYTSYTPYGGGGGLGTPNSNVAGNTDDDDERRRIYEVQRRLQMAGVNPGALDGIWGPNTQNAVRAFQQQAGLPVTGVADDAFNGALTNYLIQRQQTGQAPMAPTGTPQNVEYVNGQVLVNGLPYQQPTQQGAGTQGSTTPAGYPQVQPYVAPTMKMPTLTEAIDSIYQAVFAPTVSAQQANAKAQFESLISKGMDVLEKRMARKGMLHSGMTLKLEKELLATEGANLAEKILAYEMDARKAALSAGQSYWNTLNQNALEQQRMSYQMWKDARDDMMEAYKLGLEEEEKELEKAWERVDRLGYVDNEAAIILKIAPGTASFEAEKARLNREHELAMQRNTINAQQTQEKKFKESIYYKLNNGIPLTPDEQTFIGTNPEGNMMAKAIAAAQKELDMWISAGTLDPNSPDYATLRDQTIDYYMKQYSGEYTPTTSAPANPAEADARARVDQWIAEGSSLDDIRKSILANRSSLESQGVDVDALLRYLDSRK